jgi:hypothetical protein
MTLADADSSAAVNAVISVLVVAFMGSGILCLLAMAAAEFWKATAAPLTQPVPPDADTQDPQP